jgi:hypothetical protein
VTLGPSKSDNVRATLHSPTPWQRESKSRMQKGLRIMKIERVVRPFKPSKISTRQYPPPEPQPHPHNPQPTTTIHYAPRTEHIHRPAIPHHHKHRPPVPPLRLNNSQSADRGRSRARCCHCSLHLRAQLPHTRAAKPWPFRSAEPGDLPGFASGSVR